jgi:hypothetical protein
VQAQGAEQDAHVLHRALCKGKDSRFFMGIDQLAVAVGAPVWQLAYLVPRGDLLWPKQIVARRPVFLRKSARWLLANDILADRAAPIRGIHTLLWVGRGSIGQVPPRGQREGLT